MYMYCVMFSNLAHISVISIYMFSNLAVISNVAFACTAGRVGSQIIVPLRGDEHDYRHLRLMGDLGQITPMVSFGLTWFEVVMYWYSVVTAVVSCGLVWSEVTMYWCSVVYRAVVTALVSSGLVWSEVVMYWYSVVWLWSFSLSPICLRSST